MDRPAARQRRRRAVPLGLHADGGPSGGAGRDKPRAASRGPSRSPCGRGSPATRGRSCRRGSCVERGLAASPARTRHARPGPFALGRPDALSPSCCTTRASPRSPSRRSSCAGATRASRSSGRRPWTCRAGFHDAVLVRPGARSRRSSARWPSASRRTRTPTAALDDPGAHARGVRERLSRSGAAPPEAPVRRRPEFG